MASEVGEVKVIIGKVEVVGPNGLQALHVGDKVFSDQVISTGPNGAVEIEFLDGSILDLARNSQIILDNEAYNPSVEIDTQQDDATSDIAQVILDGGDPTQDSESTSSSSLNPLGENEGSTTYQVKYDAPVAKVVSGIDTSVASSSVVGGGPQDTPFSSKEEQLNIQNNEIPAPISVLTPTDSPDIVLDDKPTITLGTSEDESSEFSVVNHDEVSSAGYHSSYGYYVKTLDADGNVISDNPTKGVIIENDVKFGSGGFTGTETVTGYSIEQIGYFIVPDGGRRNNGLDDNTDVTFKFENGQWRAFSGDTPISGRGSHLLFDNGELNKDGQDHLVDNRVTGNQNWEDLQISTGRADFNDVNTNVDWTKVTVTGDSIESISYGDDQAGTIDFTLSEDIVIDGTLTSNGQNIEFSARDTDNDQHNDQIVGLTADGEEVLTIDGLLDGDYSLNVLGPIDDSNDDSSVALKANLSVSDNDGSTVNQILNINLNIDTNQVLNDLVPPTTEP